MGISFFPRPPDVGMVEITDPGIGGTITSTEDNAIVPVESAGIEARSLAAPTKIGQRLTIYDKTHGGLVSITAPTALDASFNNIIQLTAARAIIELISIVHAGTVKWQAGWKSPEVTLNSP